MDWGAVDGDGVVGDGGFFGVDDEGGRGIGFLGVVGLGDCAGS